MQTITLSASALALLRRRANGEEVDVTDATRPAYRELVEAGVMMPMGSFTKESAFWFTEEGWNRRFELLENGPNASTPVPSPGRSASPVADRQRRLRRGLQRLLVAHAVPLLFIFMRQDRIEPVAEP